MDTLPKLPQLKWIHSLNYSNWNGYTPKLVNKQMQILKWPALQQVLSTDCFSLSLRRCCFSVTAALIFLTHLVSAYIACCQWCLMTRRPTALKTAATPFSPILKVTVATWTSRHSLSLPQNLSLGTRSQMQLRNASLAFWVSSWRHFYSRQV